MRSRAERTASGFGVRAGRSLFLSAPTRWPVVPVVLLDIYKIDADTAAAITAISQIKDDALEVEHVG
jgi:hypothetical protein